MLELNPGDYFSIKQGWESAHPWDAEDIEERLLLEKKKAQIAPYFIERVLKKSTMAYSSSQTIKNHNVSRPIKRTKSNT